MLYYVRVVVQGKRCGDVHACDPINQRPRSSMKGDTVHINTTGVQCSYCTVHTTSTAQHKHDWRWRSKSGRNPPTFNFNSLAWGGGHHMWGILLLLLCVTRCSGETQLAPPPSPETAGCLRGFVRYIYTELGAVNKGWWGCPNPKSGFGTALHSRHEGSQNKTSCTPRADTCFCRCIIGTGTLPTL